MNHLVQHNKQYHRKVLLRSFQLNGHTLEFHSQTQKVRTNHLVQHDKQHHRKVLLRSFQLNGDTLEFHPQSQTLERTTLYSIHVINSTTGKYSLRSKRFRAVRSKERERESFFGSRFISCAAKTSLSLLRKQTETLATQAIKESTAPLLSIEWSHFRILSSDAEGRITLSSILNSHRRKVLRSSFRLNGCILVFHPRTLTFKFTAILIVRFYCPCFFVFVFVFVFSLYRRCIGFNSKQSGS